MPPDNTPDDNAPSPTAPAAKKAKLPDFDWSANNYELTWRLVNELVKPENKPVLFPEIEGVRVRSSAYPTLPRFLRVAAAILLVSVV